MTEPDPSKKRPPMNVLIPANSNGGAYNRPSLVSGQFNPYINTRYARKIKVCSLESCLILVTPYFKFIIML